MSVRRSTTRRSCCRTEFSSLTPMRWLLDQGLPRSAAACSTRSKPSRGVSDGDATIFDSLHALHEDVMCPMRFHPAA